MAPKNVTAVEYVTSEDDDLQKVREGANGVVVAGANDAQSSASDVQPPARIVWRNVVRMLVLHCVAVVGVCLIPSAKPWTWLWGALMFELSSLGITAGAHRLWSHRSYSARTPLRVFLAICQTMALQNDIIEWVRDHRVHHKYSETDADPHNARRGFFFAHCGWLMVRKHPQVKVKGQQLDISDVVNDPVCAFQRRFYVIGSVLFGLVLPAAVPWYFWHENVIHAFTICSILRYVLSLHLTWLVNSVAHLWGMRPYDKHINPRENLLVTLGALGEGFHNYHHTFPQDYSTSEFGWRFNVTTSFIDCCAALGLVTQRKKMSPQLVRMRRARTGDVSNGLKYGGF